MKSDIFICIFLSVFELWTRLAPAPLARAARQSHMQNRRRSLKQTSQSAAGFTEWQINGQIDFEEKQEREREKR